MKWGFFGPVHIASLVIAAALVVGLYFILKKCSAKTQTWILGILSFSGIAAIVFNLVSWDSPLEYLPFHLCSLNAMVLPVAVFTRNKTLNNLLLLWSLGALAAVVVNSAQADFEIMSPTFCFYFFPHVLEFAIPILMFRLGLVKKAVKYIWTTLVITLVSYTAIHLFNLWLNSYCLANQILTPGGSVVQVNYMYSLIPENPLLALFYSILPYRYWYMLLLFPVVGIYLGILYLPQILAKRRSKTAV